MRVPRSRSYLFTVDCAADCFIESLLHIRCKYIIYSLTTMADSSISVRGYVQFESPRLLPFVATTSCRTVMDPATHIHRIRQSEHFIQRGVHPNQGQRTDLDHLAIARQRFRENCIRHPDIYLEMLERYRFLRSDHQ